jgi:hypothetical protein
MENLTLPADLAVVYRDKGHPPTGSPHNPVLPRNHRSRFHGRDTGLDSATEEAEPILER